MTDPTTAVALLRDAENYLSALHGSVARHDNLAANFACAGCEMRDKIRAALAAAPSTDQATLRDRIVEALAVADGWQLNGNSVNDLPDRELAPYRDNADAVMSVLPAPATDEDRDEAEAQAHLDALAVLIPEPAADRAAAEPFPIWTVWREDQPAHGHFATEDIAKQASIDCWEEDEPVCPDYSWRRDGPRWELVVGGEAGGVYVSRHLVYGGLPQPPRAAVLDEAADVYDRLIADMGADVSKDPRYWAGVLHVVMGLRRLAGEARAQHTSEGA